MGQALFSKILKANRKKSGKSQWQVAEEAGFDRSYISLLERSMRQPSLETVVKLSKVLNTKASRLIEEMESLEETQGTN